jgi:hypothetical protein
MTAYLHAANSQWATRPADERFWNLTDMTAACAAARQGSGVAKVPFGQLRTVASGDSVALVGPTGTPANFTHYAFGQFAASVGAPAGYLRELPPATAAECLNAGITRAAEADRKSDRNLLFHKNGGLTLRASLSDAYDRVWDDDVCRMLTSLDGWRAPAGRAPGNYHGPTRAATTDDILPGQINIEAGQQIAPSGLYASDHDMFAFLVAPDRVVNDGAGGALMRGVFVRNSEVGDASLSVTFFLMQAVCGNHIVWNATGVHEIRVRHVGENTMHRAFRGFEAQLRRYHDAAPEEERGIIAARNMILGATKAECLDAIAQYAKSHSLPLSRTRIADALDIAEEHEAWYGNPRSLWAAVAGITHGSQTTGYADDRAATDRAAGKLLEMAF